MNVRLDLLNLSVDENSDDHYSTPAVHLTTDLRIYDHLGEQTWLHGGSLEANRLRSIEINYTGIATVGAQINLE